MTRQNRIRQTFILDLDLLYRPEKDTWLVKGDFDHFKRKNDLYGSLIADYLLDWALEVIEAELKSHQRRWGCGDILCSATGDDLTIYIPPSPLTEEDVRQLLWDIRNAIQTSFEQRYKVGALALPADFFENVPSYLLETIRNELEAIDVVFDFAVRQRGFLLLIPVDSGGQSRPVVDKVLQIIQRRVGKSTSALDLQTDWIFDPDDCTCYTFNGAFLDVPAVSFAACSTRIGMAGRPMNTPCTSVFETISDLCQSALKICKQCGEGVILVNKDEIVAKEKPARPVGSLPPDSPSRLRWSSERYLREVLYFKQLDQPVLFQFNPVYQLESAIRGDILQEERYRGNSFGMGLKGINEILGQNTASRVIFQLISTFSEIMRTVLTQKRIPPDKVSLAQFVDRISVFCEMPVFHPSEAAELVRTLAIRFNAVSNEIKIPHLHMSFVLGVPPSIGYRLFDQLALTGFSNQSSTLGASDPRVEVRQGCAAAFKEGRLNQERSSFSSATLLATCNGNLLKRT